MTSKKPAISKGEAMSTEAKEGPHFTVHTIYIKDLSFEAPRSPHIFNEEWKPKLEFDLQMRSEGLSEGLYEVILHLTLNIKLPEDKPGYLIEVQQGGVFGAKGFSDEILKKILATTCPEIIFPYLRETVSSLVTRGGFPQLMLPPMNFEAMYAQYLAKQATKEAEEKEQKSAEGI